MKINPRRLLSASVCGLALSALAGFAQAAPVSAWELGTVDGYRNASWSFGDIFTVGSSAVTVNSLGALDVGKDGFSSTGGILVGMFRESDGSLLASGAVLSTSTLVGNYRFTDIADILLDANTAYRVVAVNNADLYNIATSTPSLVDPRITWNRYGYCNTTVLTRCDTFAATERTWLANFQLDDGGTVPEPGTLALVGLAFAGLGVVRRRKR